VLGFRARASTCSGALRGRSASRRRGARLRVWSRYTRSAREAAEKQSKFKRLMSLGRYEANKPGGRGGELGYAETDTLIKVLKVGEAAWLQFSGGHACRACVGGCACGLCASRR
jgi:hypothetical protein